jgi:iron complex outermembrane receptor protein
VRVTERLAVNGSLRFDRRAGLDPTVSPRVAAIVDVTTRTTVKWLYGHVFRFPNAYEQYYHDASYQKVNPDLEPESVHTWEVQVDQRFGRRARLAVGAFESRIEDLINQAEDPADGFAWFANMQDVRARGIEVEFEGKRQDGPPLLRAAYTLQWAEDGDSSVRLSNSPTHLGRVGALVPLTRWQTTMAAEAQYIGGRTTLLATELPGAWLVNVDLAFGVRNLFGASYSDPVSLDHLQDSIEQDGRTVRLTLTYRLGR